MHPSSQKLTITAAGLQTAKDSRGKLSRVVCRKKSSCLMRIGLGAKDELSRHAVYLFLVFLSIARGWDELKNRLEEIRKQKDIRQEDLAAALEVSRQTISSLENGRYNPSIILAFKIARYFGMGIEEIFLYEEEEEQENETV